MIEGLYGDYVGIVYRLYRDYVGITGLWRDYRRTIIER